MPLHRRLPKRGFNNSLRAEAATRSISAACRQAIDAGKLDAGAHGRRRGAGEGRAAAPRQGRRAPARQGRAQGQGRRFRSGAPRNRRSRRSKRPAARSRSSPAKPEARTSGGADPYRTSRTESAPIAIGPARPAARHAELAERHGLGSRTTGGELNFSALRQGRGAEEAHLVHARRAAGLPARHLHPAARHRSVRAGADLPAAGRAAFSACSTCSPAAPSTAWRSSRWTSCPTSPPRSSCS